MIKIKSIKVSNFMSISEINLTFPDGITELTGLNLDSGGSNGTGKSSLLLAIPFCLFNKNPNLGLQKVNNTVTGRPYRIVLEIETKGAYYTIDNDRDTNTITITKNGDKVTTRIKESLRYIEDEILHLTYGEFIALTFITSDSLKSIFDITSANLLLKLFSLSKIDEYVNTLKMERRVISKELTKLRASKKTFSPKGIKDIEESIKDIEEEIQEATTDLHNLELTKRNFNESRLIELQNKKATNKTGVCPTCNQVVALEEYSEEELDSLVKERKGIYDEYTLKSSRLHKLEAQLRVLHARKVALLEVSQEVVKVSQDELIELQSESDVINNTLKIIAQGTIHQVYLNQFLRALNNNLTTNMKGNFQIKAILTNSSITYKVKTDNHYKEIEQLSGGEATTIAIIILTSIFKTLSQLLNIDVNLLVLDEAIHMVDEDNKEFISDLLKEIPKNIIIVQHEDNINPRVFNNSIQVIKENGIARLGALR